MNKIALLFSALLVALTSTAQVFPVVDLKVTGDPDTRINIAILPDGFMASELPVFKLTVDSICKNMFLQTPLKEYTNFFNAYCLEVPSIESGTDHPATATDVTEPIIPVAVVNTYFSCTFDGHGTHRALECDNEAAAFSVLAASFPAYDQIIMLANSFEYGGTGGPVATVSREAHSTETALHEFGHSFAGLADEYWAGTGFAMEKPNMTAETDTALVKWHNWLGKDGVGVYKYGNTTDDSLWRRPHQNCKMQFLGRAFCHVCQETIIDRIYQILTPIDSLWPAGTVINHTSGAALEFRMKLIKPIPNTLKIKWQLNGADLASTDTSIVIINPMLVNGPNTLTVYVTDTTKLSRSYWPAAGYVFPVTWDINQSATGVINIANNKTNDRFFYKLYPLPVKGDLTMAYDNQTKDESARYSITDMSGRIIRNGNLQLQKGKQTLQLNTAGMIPGNYILTVNSASVYVSEQIVVE